MTPATSVFTRPSAKGVPQPFKPQEYSDCAGIVLMPKVKQLARHEGRSRLEIVADLYIFDEQSDIDALKPSETIEMVVTWGRIASLLNRAMVDNRPVAACVKQDAVHPEWGTRPWTLSDLDEETYGKLATWFRNRG